MRRHHLIVLLPLFVTAGFVGWFTASAESVPIPIIVTVLVLGPSVFVAAGLWHWWRVRRRRANGRSLFGR
ncbi:hypothetical protein [Nonomuraea pusilla]|uniref:Uncharacterized protein n=1 Tax=Nonomuraea pusilla TaxID=46177 RepID=A0A1H8JF61_9ACTN|nr:hypothetical protein [Nonomuraea pusilla]SEN79261.1 hypothetical protein SAMN05660976_08333 [Nonomuraea pusilla]